MATLAFKQVGVFTDKPFLGNPVAGHPTIGSAHAAIESGFGRKTLPFATKLLRIDVGPVWVVGEVADARKLAALQPDMAALADFSHDVEATGVTVFAASGEKGSAIHVRSFAPAH